MPSDLCSPWAEHRNTRNYVDNIGSNRRTVKSLDFLGAFQQQPTHIAAWGAVEDRLSVYSI